MSKLISYSTGSAVEKRETKRAPAINIRLTRPGDLSTAVNEGSYQSQDQISQSAFKVTFSPAISLDKTRKYELLPYNGSIPYTSPNIGPSTASIPGFASGNNRVTITWPGVRAGAAYDYLLPTGLYGVDDLTQALNILAAASTASGGMGLITDPALSPLFIFSGISATQQLILTLSPAGLSGGVFPVGNIVIDFTNPSAVSGKNDSIGPMLGWPVTGGGATITYVAASGATPVGFTGPNAANLAIATEYVLNCDVVSGSYIGGRTGTGVYSVPLGSWTPNSIISIEPKFTQPVPVGTYDINSMTWWVTDQSGNILPGFNGESWSIAFALQETPD